MRFQLVPLLCATALLAACDPETPPSGVEPREAFGRLRFVNAAPDTALTRLVNVWFDGNPNVPLAGGLLYAGLPPVAADKGATPYRAIYAGDHVVNVRKTADTSVVVLDATLTLADATDYTVVATGVTGDLIPLVLTDDNTPAEGQAKLRVANVAPSAGGVDVYVTAPAADITALAPTLTNVTYRSASGYLPVAPGAYQIRLTTTGTKTVVLDATTAALTAGQIRTLVALDKPGTGAPFTYTILTDR
jgi:hypothetical protein